MPGFWELLVHQPLPYILHLLREIQRFADIAPTGLIHKTLADTQLAGEIFLIFTADDFSTSFLRILAALKHTRDVQLLCLPPLPRVLGETG